MNDANNLRNINKPNKQEQNFNMKRRKRFTNECNLLLQQKQQQQQHKQNYHEKISESSEISSNNLTCSDLDASNATSTANTNSNNNNNNNNFYNSDGRIQRKKLIKCIIREDLDLLKVLINQQNLLNIRDKHQNTLLHIACGFGRLKSVQFLISVCSQLLNEIDDKQHNPIDVAIKHGQTEIIKWLINANILTQFQNNLSSNSQRSYLHLAAKHGENEILKLICQEMFIRQISIDIQDAFGNTPAHLAAKYNHLDCLQTLIEYNCDITICNKYGHTACFVAEYNGNNECVNYLMMVETCINLSIKVVKLSRKFRETKANNDILKAQMDEAIAINNDFINQRENALFISLELMQKQILDIENQVLSIIEKIKQENSDLKQQLNDLLNKMTVNNNEKRTRIKDIDNSDMNTTNDRLSLIMNNLNSSKTELLNTQNNCNSILALDHKKLENVKSKFTQIKNFMETTEIKNSNNNINNDENYEDSKEHLEIIRRMYQEATHKLMIFRSTIKEKRLNSIKKPYNIKLYKNINYNQYNPSNEFNIINAYAASSITTPLHLNSNFTINNNPVQSYQQLNDKNQIIQKEENDNFNDSNSDNEDTIIDNYNLNNENFTSDQQLDDIDRNEYINTNSDFNYVYHNSNFNNNIHQENDKFDNSDNNLNEYYEELTEKEVDDPEEEEEEEGEGENNQKLYNNSNNDNAKYVYQARSISSLNERDYNNYFG